MNNHYSDYVGSANPAVTVRSSILVQVAAMGDFAVEMPGYSRGIGFDIGFPVIARREMREDDLLDARGGGDFADLLPGQVVFAHMFHQRRNLIGGEARIALQHFFHAGRWEEARGGKK